jgi:hypothetical protein
MSKLLNKLGASLLVLIPIIILGVYNQLQFSHTITLSFYVIVFLSIFLSLFIIDLISLLLESRVHIIVCYIIYLLTGVLTIPTIMYILIILAGWLDWLGAPMRD